MSQKEQQVYAYHLTYELGGEQKTIEIDGVNASHAYSEAMDDPDILPPDAVLINIVRGEPRSYTV